MKAKMPVSESVTCTDYVIGTKPSEEVQKLRERACTNKNRFSTETFEIIGAGFHLVKSRVKRILYQCTNLFLYFSLKGKKIKKNIYIYSY